MDIQEWKEEIMKLLVMGVPMYQLSPYGLEAEYYQVHCNGDRREARGGAFGFL